MLQGHAFGVAAKDMKAPLTNPKAPSIAPRDAQGTSKALPRDTKWDHQGHHGTPKDSQGLPQSSQRRLRDVHDSPKRLQGTTKGPSRTPGDTPRTAKRPPRTPEATARAPRDAQGISEDLPRDTQRTIKDLRGPPRTPQDPQRSISNNPQSNSSSTFLFVFVVEIVRTHLCFYTSINSFRAKSDSLAH